MTIMTAMRAIMGAIASFTTALAEHMSARTRKASTVGGSIVPTTALCAGCIENSTMIIPVRATIITPGGNTDARG